MLKRRRDKNSVMFERKFVYLVHFQSFMLTVVSNFCKSKLLVARLRLSELGYLLNMILFNKVFFRRVQQAKLGFNASITYVFLNLVLYL